MNQTFNIDRFGLLLKRYMVENRKQLFFLFGVMWGVMILASACIGHYEIDALILHSNPFYDPYQSRSILYLTVGICFACIIASFMFSALRTKQSRIMALMLPASMTEKYWVNFTVYILLFFPVYILGTMVADLAHYVMSGGSPLFCVFSSRFFQNIFASEYLAILIAYQAIYALGSALWPKLSFFKTFLALFVAMIVLIFMPSLFIHYLFNPFDNAMIPLGTISVACYVLAWLRFRHVQVIQKFL